MARKKLGTSVKPSSNRPKPGTVIEEKNRGDVLAWGNGYNLNPTYPGTYDTYRKMRCNPTIAIARSVATAPIRAAGITYEAPEMDEDDERLRFVQDVVNDLWPCFVDDAVRFLDYGWCPFEKVWQQVNGRLVLDRLRPLRQEYTTILVDDYGTVTGIKTHSTELEPDKMLIVTHDSEYGDPYGRARNENVREHAWQPWLDVAKKMHMYFTKAAGVIPMIEYPMGQSNTISGGLRDNSELAVSLLANLGKGNGVAMPRTYIRSMNDLDTLIQNGVDLSQLKAWQISFLETASGHGDELIEALRHYERLMLRGWLIPERTIAEGTTGTRADAEAHADIAVLMAQEAFGEIVRQFNEQVMEQLLVLNFGESARRSIRVKEAPIVDETKRLMRDLTVGLLTNPANVDIALKALDWDAMLDAADLPKRDDVANLADLIPSFDAPGMAEQVIGEETARLQRRLKGD
jgi:hypothetical protein